MYANALYVVPSAICLALAMYPLPWHLKTRNVATLSMIFWMTSQNLIRCIDGLVWSDNTQATGLAWGDISCAFTVGYGYGLPLAHLVLAKQLELYTTLRPNSPLYDSGTRRRHSILDLSLTFGGPILAILLHLSTMDRRFYIIERFGPMPATYWNSWAVFSIGIVPIFIAFGCGLYTTKALMNVKQRRKQLRSLVASEGSINKEQFWRLLALAVLEMGTCVLRAVFNLLSFQNGPQLFGKGGPDHSLTMVEQVPWTEIDSGARMNLNLQFFTVIACSIVFFLCLATSTETRRFYGRLVKQIFPCMPSSGSRSTVTGSKFGTSHRGLTTQLTTIGASSTVSVDHKSAFETASFTKESIQDASPTDTLGRIAPWESHQNRTISEPDFQKGNAEKWTHTTLPALGKQSPSLSDVSSEEGVLVTYERITSKAA